MQPVSFFEETTVLPCDDQLVEPLPVATVMFHDRVPGLISCWKLTPEEFEEILRTKRIYLIVYSNIHPVVSITANNPFENNSV
jgi:hypothetical protein